LVRILTEPKNALIKQYQVLFALDNVKLEFTDEAIHEIARIAFESKIGARGLRTIIEGFMTDIMFAIPDDITLEKCIITKDTVLNNANPELIHNVERKTISSISSKKRKSRKFGVS
jgi:ATP-dependent Clp protease ATP-binding subunit ClpX